MLRKFGLLLATSTSSEISADAAEKIADAGEQINSNLNWIQERIPDMISFGIRLALCLIFFMIGRSVIGWIRRASKRSMDRANVDSGVKQFVDSMLKIGLYTILVFMIATRLGVKESSVAALLASSVVALSLALQGSLSNFAGGLLILLTKPFVVGDYIIEDTHKNEGYVKEIRVFHTKLTTVDNRTIIIPNGNLINNSLTNVTACPERLLDLQIGISYQADIKKAKEILEGLICEDKDILASEQNRIFVSELGDSAVILGVRALVSMELYWDVRWRLLENIKECFDAAGIEIPYNQLTVHVEEEK